MFVDQNQPRLPIQPLRCSRSAKRFKSPSQTLKRLPTAQVTCPAPQVALNLSTSQFHRPLRHNNLRPKIEKSSSNLSASPPPI